ncbi:uncharacterized protein LOC135820990 [Sycon ciliatum]|uniref:uncharacterized protein LOC135820990 n=1 Tax=Sycon ciliatum TaxID=27933 RepID=UPI0031F6E8BA
MACTQWPDQCSVAGVRAVQESLCKICCMARKRCTHTRDKDHRIGTRTWLQLGPGSIRRRPGGLWSQSSSISVSISYSVFYYGLLALASALLIVPTNAANTCSSPGLDQFCCTGITMVACTSHHSVYHLYSSNLTEQRIATDMVQIPYVQLPNSSIFDLTEKNNTKLVSSDPQKIVLRTSGNTSSVTNEECSVYLQHAYVDLWIRPHSRYIYNHVKNVCSGRLTREVGITNNCLRYSTRSECVWEDPPSSLLLRSWQTSRLNAMQTQWRLALQFDASLAAAALNQLEINVYDDKKQIYHSQRTQAPSTGATAATPSASPTSTAPVTGSTNSADADAGIVHVSVPSNPSSRDVGLWVTVNTSSSTGHQAAVRKNILLQISYKQASDTVVQYLTTVVLTTSPTTTGTPGQPPNTLTTRTGDGSSNSVTASSTSNPSVSTSDDNDDGGDSEGGVAIPLSIAFGGALLLLIAIVVIVFVRRKKRERQWNAEEKQKSGSEDSEEGSVDSASDSTSRLHVAVTVPAAAAPATPQPQPVPTNQDRDTTTECVECTGLVEAEKESREPYVGQPTDAELPPATHVPVLLTTESSGSSIISVSAVSGVSGKSGRSGGSGRSGDTASTTTESDV